MSGNLGEELAGIIERSIRDHPRTLQTDIGPSEIGSDCRRFLGFKLLNVPPRRAVESAPIGWAAFVGTALHHEFEVMFTNQAMREDQRWLTETRLVVDERGRYGSCDLYDAKTCTVVDWKSKGTKADIAKVRNHGPKERERKQAHMYGLGWERAGMVVETVALFFVARGGNSFIWHYWSEPYDRDLALATLANLDEIQDLADALGRAAIPLLETADDCRFCPYFDALASPRSEVSCLGDPSHTGRVDSTTSLIAPKEYATK